MILGQVVGTVVATRKDERLMGAKLLLVRSIDPHGKDEAAHMVAVLNSAVERSHAGIIARRFAPMSRPR